MSVDSEQVEKEGAARILELEEALRDVRFHTGRGPAKDGTILSIRETVDRALASCSTCSDRGTVPDPENPVVGMPCPDCSTHPETETQS